MVCRAVSFPWRVKDVAENALKRDGLGGDQPGEVFCNILSTVNGIQGVTENSEELGTGEGTGEIEVLD